MSVLLPYVVLLQHHCRRCGRVCCASCCDTRLALPRMCFLDPVRVCTPCAQMTIKENIFFSKDLKTLVSGEYPFSSLWVPLYFTVLYEIAKCQH